LGVGRDDDEVMMKSTFCHSAGTNQWWWEIPLDRGLLPTPLTIIFCSRRGFYHRRKSPRIDRPEIGSRQDLFYGRVRRNSTKAKKPVLEADVVSSGGAFMVLGDEKKQ